jgi:glycosyltransferase involved in cell wall biosynthesis
VQGECGLNLLFVGPYPPRQGGTAPSLLQLTSALSRRGHTVRVVAAITPQEADFDRAFVPTLDGIRLTRYVVPHYIYRHETIPFDEDHRRLERRALGRLLPRMIRAERPDVIVAGLEPLAWYVPQIARRHGIPSVLLLRGGPTFRIVEGSFPEEHARAWLEMFAQADRIVPVSRFFEEGLRSRGMTRVSAIQNHVDVDLFRPAPKDAGLLEELALRPDQIVVGHVSKLDPRKRVLDLVAAAARVGEPGTDVAYVIVGDGEMLGEVKDACRKWGVSDRFRFPGWVPYERIPSFLNLADVVVQPSETEGLSRVYLEAMACGRVLIATDIPAAAEVIRDGRNGLLFPMGDVDALADVIRRAAADPEMRQRIGRNARATALSHSLDRKVEEYLDVFNEVISRA